MDTMTHEQMIAHLALLGWVPLVSLDGYPWLHNDGRVLAMFGATYTIVTLPEARMIDEVSWDTVGRETLSLMIASISNNVKV